MSLPRPRPGLVIRYSFLWSAEAEQGATEGRKDRPCAIVVAVAKEAGGGVQTIVAPITHSPPADPSTSLEIPAQTCRALGLDEGRNWLRLDELNRFVWPGYDTVQRRRKPVRKWVGNGMAGSGGYVGNAATRRR